MLALPVVLGFAHVVRVHAQAVVKNQDIVGTWQGTLYLEEAKARGLRLDPGRDLHLVVKISKADGGAYKGFCYSIDQNGDPIPVANVMLEGTTVKLSLPFQRSTYEGKLAPDGGTITGFIWNNDVGPGPNPMPLNLTRATAETEWTIPPEK